MLYTLIHKTPSISKATNLRTKSDSDIDLPHCAPPKHSEADLCGHLSLFDQLQIRQIRCHNTGHKYKHANPRHSTNVILIRQVPDR